MTERPLYESGINRHPPQIGPQVMVKMPEPKEFGEGRIGWPEIFEYATADGAHTSALPLKEPYKIIVHDQARYDALCRTGIIRDERHTGLSARIVEGRRDAPKD